jgi:hypothetical protein
MDIIMDKVSEKREFRRMANKVDTEHDASHVPKQEGGGVTVRFGWRNRGGTMRRIG